MRISIVSLLLSLVLIFEIVFYHLSEEIRISLFLCIVLLLTLLFVNKKSFFIPKKFTLLFLLYLSANIISSITAGFNFLLLLEVGKLLSIYLLVILATNIFRADKKTLPFIFFPLVFVAAIFALMGILEFSGRISPQKVLPLIVPFYWPTISASFFLLITPLTLSYFLLVKNYILKKILFACLFFLITAWILSQSYQLFMIAILTFSSGFYLWLIKKRKDAKVQDVIRNIAIFILLIIVILPNLFTSFGGNRIPKEIASNQDQFFFFDRADVIRFSFESIKKYIFSGIGPGNFGPVYSTQQTQPWTWSNYAGSEPLQTLVETGILGLVSLCLLYFYLYFLFIKKFISVHKADFFTIIISLSALFLLTINLFDIPIRIFPIALIFYLFTAFLLQKEEKLIISTKKSAFLMLPIFFLAFVVFSDALFLNLSQRYLLNKRYQESSYFLNYLSKRPKIILNPKVLIWRSALFLDEDLSDKALEELQKFASFYPDNLDVDYQIAAIIYKKGDKDRAVQILEREISKNPYSGPKYYLTLSKIALENEDHSRANFWLKKGISIYPIDTKTKNSYVLLSILDAINYLSPVQELYLTLFESTDDHTLFNSLIRFIY